MPVFYEFPEPPDDVAGFKPIETATSECSWDHEAAQLAIDFYPTFLKHVEGRRVAGKPIALEGWQKRYIATLFGWKRADGTRRFRESLCAIPRKNGKTTICAGAALFVTLCDREPGAKTFIAAGDRNQARILFDIASSMIGEQPKLAEMLTVNSSYNLITYARQRSTIKAISADASSSHGYNAHCAVMDELHTQPNRDLYDVLRSSMGAREQPLMWSITTAGFDQSTICYELWLHARRVRDGVIKDWEFLPALYELPIEKDWSDPENWKIANPNLGVSIKLDHLKTEFERAKQTPLYENTFRRLHLNQWTESETRWIPSALWDKAKLKEFPDLTGRRCCVGLDLASTSDMTAAVFAFAWGEKIFIVPKFWVPEETVQKADKRYQRQYQHWVDEGWLLTTPGNATDYQFIKEEITRARKHFKIEEIRFDPWNSLDLVNQLERRGFKMTQVSQSFAGLTTGCRWVEEALLAGRLFTDGNPVLDWMISCTVVSIDSNGNQKPDKRKSAGDHGTKGKIDGVVAMVMAVDGISKAPKNPYASRGIAQI